MEPLTNCTQCGGPLKNGICPSCGWNPDAPKNLGKSEAEQNEERETRRMRHRLGLVPQATPAATQTTTTEAGAVPNAAPVPADDTESLVNYVIGMGYTEDAARSIVAKNADSIRMSLSKAKVAQSATSAQLPTLAPPDTSKGW